MIDLTIQQVAIVADIIHRYIPDCGIMAYGSRTIGKAKQFSDLDIALETSQHIKPAVLFNIKSDLSESDLPFRVDVLDLKMVSDEFLNSIKAQLVRL